MSARSVVMAGGGVSGIAWLLGVVAALRDGGIDLAEADTLVGTSAGSVVVTQLATGVLDAAARAQLSDVTTERAVDFDVERFVELAGEAAAGTAAPQDAARRMAQLPLQQHAIDATQRRAIVAARLPVDRWPERDLAVCAVDRETGERVVFRRSDGAGLVDAVTASCAVPGIWPAVTIGGRRYVDGGTYSLTNADLAPRAGRTLVLVPIVPTEDQRAVLAAELALLEPVASFVVAADDEAGAAFGPNPLDPATRAVAFAAGVRQGAASVPAAEAFWRT